MNTLLFSILPAFIVLFWIVIVAFTSIFDCVSRPPKTTDRPPFAAPDSHNTAREPRGDVSEDSAESGTAWSQPRLESAMGTSVPQERNRPDTSMHSPRAQAEVQEPQHALPDFLDENASSSSSSSSAFSCSSSDSSPSPGAWLRALFPAFPQRVARHDTANTPAGDGEVAAAQEEERDHTAAVVVVGEGVVHNHNAGAAVVGQQV